MTRHNPYNQGLDKNNANYVPLSPLSFIERTAVTHPHLPSVIYNEQRFTWAQTYERCKQVASALHRLGIGDGDTVSTMLPNIPAMYEAHFAIPMTGAVLNTLNIRLNAESLAFMLDHSECKVIFVDPEFAEVIEQTLSLMKTPAPIVIDVDDPDGYMRIRDRAKDVIISGGENIASLEIEEAILRHPAISSVAVVAMKDEKWGEVPAAFVELRADIPPITEDDLHQHCSQHLARYKLPKKYIFGELTRTSTGKVQKFALREQLNVE